MPLNSPSLWALYVTRLNRPLLPCCLLYRRHVSLSSLEAFIGRFYPVELKDVTTEALSPPRNVKDLIQVDQSSCRGAKESSPSPAFYFNLSFEDVAVICCSFEGEHQYLSDLRLPSDPPQNVFLGSDESSDFHTAAAQIAE